MAVTWDIEQLDTTKTVGSLSDVVTLIHWTASDSETVSGIEHKGYRYGCAMLADADNSSFTAYADITKDKAVEWAKAALGSVEVSAIEISIAAQITESKTPTKTSGIPSSW
jgi:hypothetical protein